MTRIAQRSGPARNASEPRWRLGRHELLAIVGFWSVFAVLMAANHLLGEFSTPGAPRGLVLYEPVFWLFNSYLWAAATPFIFWLAWRFGVQRPSRIFGVLLFLGAGAVIVTVLMLTRRIVWVEILSFPPIRGANLAWTVRGAVFSGWFLNDMVTYGGVLAVGFTREYFVRYQARLVEAARLHAQAAQLQAQLADARLEALRMRLNPHFLFNTLHAISALVERDPRGVRRMIARLSELLRYTLQSSNQQQVRVEEEIQFLQRYLDILQIRFEGRLEIETRVASEVLGALVPNLILQPLVENAVKHGIGNRVGSGRIEIYAYRKGDRLVLGVRDNGPGLQPQGEGAAGEGVGLHNVRSRLQELFGEDQSLTLKTAEGGGAIAEIEIPLQTPADLRVSEVEPAPAHATHDL